MYLRKLSKNVVSFFFEKKRNDKKNINKKNLKISIFLFESLDKKTGVYMLRTANKKNFTLGTPQFLVYLIFFFLLFPVIKDIFIDLRIHLVST